MKTFLQLILSLTFLTSAVAFANDDDNDHKSTVENVKETTKEAYQDTKKVVKKGYRKAKDKTCEMINGKMECAVQKAKNAVKNVGDEIKDKSND
jgi:ElaB/YqjD/DUF883 family membrane-anchored ribosome-binding protein